MMELEAGGHSIKGGLHKINEDRYRLLGATVPLVAKANRRGEIFAAFDGVGSAPRGGEAAQVMCDCLADFFRAGGHPSAQELFQMLFQTNLKIKEWGAIAPGSSREMGACAGTVAWFFEDNLTLFHAGDTFALLLDADAETTAQYSILTTEHQVGGAIVQYFGIGETQQIECIQRSMRDGDILVLMTDGIIKALSFPQVACGVREWIRKGSEYAATQLCNLAKLRNSPDDITAVVVEYSSE